MCKGKPAYYLASSTYKLHGVIHHCVPAMTAVVGRTTSHSLTNATLPYLMLVAEFGLVSALEREPALFRGLVLYQWRLVHAEVASALYREAHSISGIEN